MIKLFKPEDFYFPSIRDKMPVNREIVSIDRASDIANEKLEQWLKAQPVVFGQKVDDVNWAFETDKFSGDTHTAILVNVQPIEPEVKDTAESLLLEYTKLLDKDRETKSTTEEWIDIYHRTQKLLGEK